MTPVQKILHTQLGFTRTLPEPLLRAAERFVVEPETAALLAARLDLPADLRSRLREDRRPLVRAAFCSRDDLETAELAELLGSETRLAVLSDVAEKTCDPVIDMLLWQQLMTKPTKGLAAALIDSYTHHHLGSRSGRIAAPAAVVATAMGTLGSSPNVARHPLSKLLQFAHKLADGADPVTAELVAATATAPEAVRVALAAAEHLSSQTRIALLTTLWESVLVDKAESKELYALPEPFARRHRFLPQDGDVVELMLTGAGDVDDEVLDYLNAALTRMRDTQMLPAGWVEGWAGMVEAYRPTSSQDTCEKCAARIEGVQVPWSPSDLVLPARDPGRPRRGPGSVPFTDVPTAPETASVAVEQGPDAEGAPVRVLADLDDYALANLVRDGLEPADLEQVRHLGVERESTVIVAALLATHALPAPEAVDLVTYPWFSPAAEVLVRLVEQRPGQVDFALAAAGRSLTAIVRAFGPGVFADRDDPQPGRSGGVRLARHVRSVLAGTPQPGWADWAAQRSGPERLAKELQEFVTHPGTCDEALLELPWQLVATQLTAPTWIRIWTFDATQRVHQMLVTATSEILGSETAVWDAYTRMAPSFTGSVGELLDVAVTCTTP